MLKYARRCGRRLASFTRNVKTTPRNDINHGKIMKVNAPSAEKKR